MAEYNDDLNYPDPFYISDIETYELLHVNEAGRRLFKVPLDADLEGVKCYEFLQGRDEPCPFCTNHLLSVEKSYVWEFTNPLTPLLSLFWNLADGPPAPSDAPENCDF